MAPRTSAQQFPQNNDNLLVAVNFYNYNKLLTLWD